VRRPTAIGGAAILLWASLALLASLLRNIPPFEVLALSFAIAFGVGMLVIGWRGGAVLTLLRQPPAAFLLGFAGIFTYHALYFTALDLAPPAQASLISYLWPLLIVLFSSLPPGQRLKPAHALGAACGLGGTALLLLHGGVASAGHALGYAAALACAFVWSGYSVMNRRFDHVPSELIALICGAVALAGLICHLMFERTISPMPEQWLAIIALGLGPVGLAFFAWDYATKHGDLPLLGTLSYAAPLLSTGLLIATRVTPLSLPIIIAAFLIIGGAVIALRG
jgi:drug/metabolite transporter (DMT)-like permease